MLVTLIAYVFKKHNNFIDCRAIIKNHFSIFKSEPDENGKSNYLKGQIFFFFIIPLLLSISVSNISCLDNTMINVITVIMTIITSMFFTVLGLLMSIEKKDEVQILMLC